MTATALADLELPTFDYLDPELRGTRFHTAMAKLAEEDWLATMPLGASPSTATRASSSCAASPSRSRG